MSENQAENALFDQVTDGFNPETTTYMMKHAEATELVSNGWGEVLKLNNPNGDGTVTSEFRWRGKIFICVSTEAVTALPR